MTRQLAKPSLESCRLPVHAMPLVLDVIEPGKAAVLNVTLILVLVGAFEPSLGDVAVTINAGSVVNPAGCVNTASSGVVSAACVPVVTRILYIVFPVKGAFGLTVKMVSPPLAWMEPRGTQAAKLSAAFES